MKSETRLFRSLKKWIRWRLWLRQDRSRRPHPVFPVFKSVTMQKYLPLLAGTTSLGCREQLRGYIFIQNQSVFSQETETPCSIE